MPENNQENPFWIQKEKVGFLKFYLNLLLG